MDLIDDEGGPAVGGDNAHAFSVSELSGAVKRALEDGFGRVRVRGEVGRVFAARSGHLYFDLKDDRAVVAAVAWKGQAARLAHRPEEGMEVVVTGRMTTFGSQSKYQIVVDDVRPAGAGALMAQLEARRRKLAADGLFDPARKRAVPFLPRTIGVVTSPGGAVIRDILHRVADRFPRRVLVWPVAVQGRGSAEEVAAAIGGFDAMTGPSRPDVLIVARGGGSIEDLWGFNEEVVVRAAAACNIPLISAVGHETDTTLIDHAADLRAPTPTAAAEAAVPVRAELLAGVRQLDARLIRAGAEAVRGRRQRVRDLARALPRPETLTEGPRQRLDLAAERLPGALRGGTARRRLALERLAGALRPRLLSAGIAAQRTRLGEAGRRLEEGARRAADARRERTKAQGDRAAAALGRAARAARRGFEERAGRLRADALLRGARDARGRLGTAQAAFAAAAGRDHDRRRRAVDRLRALNEALGYRNTLRRGYAVVRGPGGVLTHAGPARAAARLQIEFQDGEMAAVPEDAPARPARRARPKPGPDDQGTLF
ncbi:exodeoxyribonuclease VII large subunit [Hasllibacter halocynthiae]|uniref:Exodeoxyribonuclease 7 large subunit n=1 Tax=Hasllibacter halocynthiae TaxID=595589 RepID=A0A2T0X6B8_9RHOB|nr:exodeoxyribonuclease VII large subunit [Hasllibacter halocynthiae]PRY94479.1 exodeoxyribonuclease VII large subunit [Hasllibacter halocynthiae]